MIKPKELKNLYLNGCNIIQHLRAVDDHDYNTNDMIEMSYDLQAGSYTAAMNDTEMKKYKNIYTAELARIILSLCNPDSILEAGVGEATTLSGVLKNIDKNITSYGFDLSWSRVVYAKSWLEKKGIKNTTLCTGDLLNIPFSDNSIDVVYTSHSIEPNRGNEKEILQELFRVARKYLILLEPGYELVCDEARKRMDLHGYCRNLKSEAESLGYKILTHELFPVSVNPLNATAITVIEKLTTDPMPLYVLTCPQYKNKLDLIGGMLFSEEALSVYPVLGGIPCLRKDNAIIASHYKEFYQDF